MTSEGADMSGWENFFVGELGASAALTGLIFVGVSINLPKIMASSYLPNRALEALEALVVVLFICSLLLIPGQSFLAIGIEVLLIGLVDWMTVFLLQLNNLRKMQAQYRRAYVRSIVVCQMAALCFVIAGMVLLIFGTNGLYWVVAATLLSFLAAFTDAWVLLIEINR
jgi:L-asparagine transporter-like permease